MGNLGKEDSAYAKFGDLIAVISLCLTCLGLGYSIGSNSDKTTKK